MKHSEETAKINVKEYIDNRIAGSNKMESAQLAGYSESTSRNIPLIERTKAYATIITEVLHDNSTTMREVLTEYRNIVETKPVDWEKAKKVIDVAEKQAKVHDILTPKVTIKETQNKDGTVTRTAWGTNSSQLNETLGK